MMKMLIEAEAQVGTQAKVIFSVLIYDSLFRMRSAAIKHIMYTLTVLCPQDGCTALHLAAQEGKVDVVRLLIDDEAQVNIQTKVCRLKIY